MAAWLPRALPRKQGICKPGGFAIMMAIWCFGHKKSCLFQGSQRKWGLGAMSENPPCSTFFAAKSIGHSFFVHISGECVSERGSLF